MEKNVQDQTVQRLNAALVKLLLEHAAETAERLFQRPICIAICDEHGELLGFLRMDGGPARSIQISQCKAYTAARLAASTRDLFLRLEREKEDIRFFCDPKFTAFPGGNLITNRDNRIIGAVGISGLAPHEDHEVAAAVAEFAKGW
jgi:glc operon protein GlcG